MHNFSPLLPSLPAFASADGLWTNLRLAPGAAPSLDTSPGVGAAIVVQHGRIAWIGAIAEVPTVYGSVPRYDGGDALVTPGLIDCHTHLVYGGQRANEFAMRLAGASYEELAHAGGGIVSSVMATRAASEDELFVSAAKRLEVLLAQGVCAIEIKSTLKSLASGIGTAGPA